MPPPSKTHRVLHWDSILRGPRVTSLLLLLLLLFSEASTRKWTVGMGGAKRHGQRLHAMPALLAGSMTLWGTELGSLQRACSTATVHGVAFNYLKIKIIVDTVLNSGHMLYLFADQF